MAKKNKQKQRLLQVLFFVCLISFAHICNVTAHKDFPCIPVLTNQDRVTERCYDDSQEEFIATEKPSENLPWLNGVDLTFT